VVASERLAIQLMIAQGLLFAAETAAIHQSGSRVSLMQLSLIRAAAGLGLAIVLARKIGFAVLRTGQLRLQLLRGGVGLLYMWVLMYSFARLPFADATAISYTQAAYIAVFSVLILRERVTRLRWAGAAIGIVGGILIAKPAFSGWNVDYLVALVGTSLLGFGFVLNRYLQEQESAITTMLYTNLVPFLGNLPVLMTTGLPAPDTFLWIPIILFGPIGMYIGIVAVKHANASMLGPYTLLRLVVGVLGGIVVFHEPPDAFSAWGAVLILVGCALSLGVGQSVASGSLRRLRQSLNDGTIMRRTASHGILHPHPPPSPTPACTHNGFPKPTILRRVDRRAGVRAGTRCRFDGRVPRLSRKCGR
jgi:drug/metabolite transporter (DMT)-like permease